ncbi:hypothetical protein M9H77_28161 [Catharanthus roseus]|uniref:Uncharacterized protein n=1 Tax=Catharanthus roseus TaxID=4058 RepID=A0ACC0AEL3_CATRO|nr:hypothetical protein M9H77_28161 [Catharanthus roseus]
MGYSNFSSHTRSYERNSYDCYEGNRFGTRNDFNDISCKRVQRNDVRNRGNYVNMDERFHKRKGDYEGYDVSYNNLKLHLLCGTFGPYNYEACDLEFKFMESLMIEEIPKNKELSQAKIEESFKIHVEDASKEEPSCIMNEKSIEIKEKERVEEKERLGERSCIFESIPIISKESAF